MPLNGWQNPNPFLFLSHSVATKSSALSSPQHYEVPPCHGSKAQESPNHISECPELRTKTNVFALKVDFSQVFVMGTVGI